MSSQVDQEALRRLIAARYVNVAFLTVSIYELLTSFSLEVPLIWKARWNIPKVLYILSRYLPLVVFSLLLFYGAGEPRCTTYALISTVTLSLTVCISEMIFVLRTWAAWDRGRKMGIFLGLFFSGIWVTNFTFTGLNLRRIVSRLRAEIIFGRSDPFFCLPTTSAQTSFWPGPSVILVAAFYTVTLSLMLIKAYQCFFRSGRTRLMYIFYIDGVFYYACLLIISWVTLAAQYGFVVNFKTINAIIPRLQQFFCFVFACRMTLNLRDYGRRTVRGLDSQLGGLSGISGFTVQSDPLVFNHADLGLKMGENEFRSLTADLGSDKGDMP